MTLFLKCHSISNVNILHIMKLCNLSVNSRMMDIVNTEQVLKLINFVTSLIVCCLLILRS
jgi:hypothetical protein